MLQYQPSARIERLRTVALEGSQAARYAGFRGLHFTEAFVAAEGQALVQRRGRGLAAVIAQMPVELAADEILAGHHYLGREDLDFPDLGQWSPDRVLLLRETLLTPNQRDHYCELAAASAGGLCRHPARGRAAARRACRRTAAPGDRHLGHDLQPQRARL